MSEGSAAPGIPIARRVSFFAFGALVVLAIAFYLWWGLSYGVWVDNGVYAVVIVLLLFGLAGMWLVLPSPPTTPADDAAKG
jgi:hypothetical protein